MLTGVRPFVAKNHHDLLLQIIKQDPRPAMEIRKDLPKELGDVLTLAMVRDRAKRYPTAAFFRRELLAVSQALGITPIPHMLPEVRPRMPSKEDAATRIAPVEGAPGAGARFAPAPAAPGVSAEDWPTQVYEPSKQKAKQASPPGLLESAQILELGTGDIVNDDWETATEKSVPKHRSPRDKSGPPSTRRKG